MHGSRPKAGPRTFSRSGKRGTAHHRGLVSLRISDGKFVNHTTEMILWSMILTLHHQSCLYDKPGISQQIGEQKLGTMRQNGVSSLLCLSQLLVAAHFLITLTSSKISSSENLRHLSGDRQAFPPHVRTTWASLPFPTNFMSARCFGRPNLLANGFSPKIWKVLNFASNFLRNWDNFWRWPHSFCRAHMN